MQVATQEVPHPMPATPPVPACTPLLKACGPSHVCCLPGRPRSLARCARSLAGPAPACLLPNPCPCPCLAPPGLPPARRDLSGLDVALSLLPVPAVPAPALQPSPLRLPMSLPRLDFRLLSRLVRRTRSHGETQKLRSRPLLLPGLQTLRDGHSDA